MNRTQIVPVFILGLALACGAGWAQSDPVSLVEVARQKPQQKAAMVFDDDNFQRSQPAVPEVAADGAKPAPKVSAPPMSDKQIQALETQLAALIQNREFFTGQIQMTQALLEQPGLEPGSRDKLAKQQEDNKQQLAASDRMIVDLEKRLAEAHASSKPPVADENPTAERGPGKPGASN